MENIVNSWDEWSQLRDVIVGKIDLSCIPNPEPMYCIKSGKRLFEGRPHCEESKEKANKQLDHFIKVLEKENVRVYRPLQKSLYSKVVTPFFESEFNYFTCPRDVYSVLGNTVLEAPMSWRCRYFDHQQYTPLWNNFFNLDKKMRWVSCPKPLMFDDMYQNDYPLDMKSRMYYEYNQQYGLSDIHPVFDAADIYRCGKDLFVQVGFTTNLKGYKWIKRTFSDEFNVHKMMFRNNITPTHIDAEMIIPKPGYLIFCPQRPPTNESIEKFKKNNWNILAAPEPVSTPMPDGCTSSPWISMNILSINEQLAIVEESEKEMIELLNSIGVDTIPVPFRDVYKFGGSFHCHTLDINRDGQKNDYFDTVKE